jgi:precorrin-2 methylase
MGILGNVLSSLGLGQGDVKHVTEATLFRVNKREVITAEQRKGCAIFATEMLNTLRAEDVITAETHKELYEKIESWLAQQPQPQQQAQQH